jgi:hypothetical protein
MRGAVWADADIDKAAALIRQVVDAPAEAKARGLRARAMVEQDYSPRATGAAMRTRLEAVRAGRRDADRTGIEA